MAISRHKEKEEEEEQSPSILLEALYCEEEQLEDNEEEVRERNSPSSSTILEQEQLFWEDEELLSLFSKEKQWTIDLSLSSDRKIAVEWMLKVNAHYGFSTLTAILAVNYFDRFLSSFHFQNEKPWMFQLASVTCLSLAAKIEETHVPLLLDLQVEGTKYFFEAKTIQKMELLVLSTLDWRMNPVTPMSFVDHIIRRLGLKDHLFLRRCGTLILSLLSDWRFVSYPPSVLAAAVMMHVIEQIEPYNSLHYQNQLLGVLNFTKDKVNVSYQLIAEKLGSKSNGRKRKYEQMLNANNNNNEDEEDDVINGIPSSPNGVVDYNYYDYLSSESSSSDSWEAINTKKKKNARATNSRLCNEHEYEHECLTLSRVYVDNVRSPQ